MNKLFEHLLDVFSTLSSMLIFMVLVSYCGWKGAILWLINVFTTIFWLRSDVK